MGIFRGDGGTGDSNTDATVTAVTEQATIATTKASEAADSATAAGTSATNAASSASASSVSSAASSTYAGEAASSATSAATSATASAASATAAATAETNAETAETNAETAETNAAASAATATTKAGEAATSATSASTSASTATTKASEASTSASNASTSETNAATSASTATTKASESSTSASNAATSATNAAASYDDFDDRYLGAKSSAPTTDNDGDALVTGALYFDTTTNNMKVWSGSAWLDAYASLSGALLANNNLSDLNNATTARTNLGLGTAATTASTDYATAAQGTKVDGIEAGADVTDTTNVVAALSAGTGISLSVGGVIANTSPDQAVALTGGTGISTSGTYPNFTITNDSPDQTVSLTGAGTTTVSGTYPNFTITGAGTTYTASNGITLSGTDFQLTDTNAKLNLTGGTVTGRTTFTDGISLEPNDGIRFGGTADIHLRALTNNANSAIDLSSGSLSIGGFGNTVWHQGNDDVLVKEDSTGFVPLYRTGTSGDQTIVAVVGSNSLRPVLQFSESTGTSITSGMSLEYNGVGSGDTNYMAFNSVAGSPVHKFYSGGLIETDGTVQCNTSWNEPMIRHGASGPFARSDGNYIYWDGGGTTSLYYINGFGGVVADSTVTITEDTALKLHSHTNAQGVHIEFSDYQAGSYAQVGKISYYHSDVQSYGSGNAFIFGSTETATSVVGNKAVFDNYLVKPASGTGAGSLVIDSSRNITANYMKADRIYANDDGSTGYFFNDSGTRTAYAGGDLYIQSSVGNCYIYATNTYLGNTSGDTIHTRGNQIGGNGFQFSSNGDFYVNARYGSNAMAFACRAWARYEMTGTHSFRDDEGFSSVTDIATGRSRLNFTNTMPNSSYSVNVTTGTTSYTSSVCSASVYSLSTTLFYVSVEDLDGGFTDRDQMNVMVVR